MSMTVLFGCDAARYVPHWLHRHDRVYVETNCYADALVELLWARGDDPLAILGHTIAVDFEGDQWTFFKPPVADLQALFGVDIHEMQPYLPLPLHIESQLAQGRTVCIELDAWYLPDTDPISYRREHVKTSAIVEAIDPAARRLRYFHNAGFFELEGADYDGVLRLTDTAGSAALPPYVDLVRFDAGRRLRGEQLREQARAVFVRHLADRPASNPFLRFAEALTRDLPSLVAGDERSFHAYAFVNVRMPGAAFAFASEHLKWLFGDRAATAVAALDSVVDATKALSFQLARRRVCDIVPAVGAMAADWDRAMTALDSLSS